MKMDYIFVPKQSLFGEEFLGDPFLLATCEWYFFAIFGAFGRPILLFIDSTFDKEGPLFFSYDDRCAVSNSYSISIWARRCGSAAASLIILSRADSGTNSLFFESLMGSIYLDLFARYAVSMDSKVAFVSLTGGLI